MEKTVAKILDGRSLSLKIKNDLKTKVEDGISNGWAKPRLDIVQVGNDYATSLYVGIKRKMGEDVGAEVFVHNFDESIETKELTGEINDLEKVSDGILVQLPLPDHIDTREVLDKIQLDLDVDGLNSANLEKLRRGEDDGIASATAEGVMTLLRENGIQIPGKKVCVVGNSIEVGQPLSAMFKNMGAQLSVCDINTPNTKDLAREADILTVAVGKSELVKGDWIKEGAVVVDIGINRVGDRITGDVKYDEVSRMASYISPVPGGVGPMTVVSLFKNLVTLWERKNR